MQWSGSNHSLRGQAHLRVPFDLDGKPWLAAWRRRCHWQKKVGLTRRCLRAGFLPAWIWANKYKGMEGLNLAQLIERRQEKFGRFEKSCNRGVYRYIPLELCLKSIFPKKFPITAIFFHFLKAFIKGMKNL